MNERKSFFESLEPKSAMLVGLVAGFMGLCTIGFFILGGIMLKGDRFVVKEKKSGSVVQNDNVAMPKIRHRQQVRFLLRLLIKTIVLEVKMPKLL
jgi:hypothetical protein